MAMQKPVVHLVTEVSKPLLNKLTVLAADQHTAVLVMSPNFDIVYSNGQLEKQLHLDLDSLVNTNLSYLLIKTGKTPEHLDPIFQRNWLHTIFQQLIRKHAWKGEVHCAINNQQSVFFSTSFIPHQGENGELEHIICIQTNITEHKQHESILEKKQEILSHELSHTIESLKESEERFQLATKAIGEGIWDWNINSGEIYFSPRWKSMLGYDEADISPSFYAWQQLIHPDDLGKMLMVWVDYMEGALGRYYLEYRMKTKSGEYLWVQSQAVSELDDEGTPYRMAGSHSDIHKRKIYEAELEQYQEHLEQIVSERTRELAQANESLRRLATIDALTNLPNRRTFDNTLEHEWKRCQKEGAPLSLVMIDVDFFKSYNDTFGHQAGDDVLQAVGSVFGKTLKRPTDFAARYGGEEFSMVLPMTDIAGAEKMAEAVRVAIELLAMPAATTTASPYVTISLGMATCIPTSEDTLNFDTLLHASDDALYEAKDSGRNRVCLSNFGMGLKAQPRMQQLKSTTITKSMLYQAMEDKQFRLMFQPQCNVVKKSIFAFETLIRWNHTMIGPMPPGQFIPQAIELGVMPSIDKWIIAQTLKVIKSQLDTSLEDTRFSINLSEQLLENPATPELLFNQLQENNIPKSMIEFEVAEQVLLNRQYEQRWKAFHELGLTLVIDNCTVEGICSGMFSRLPVHAIKLNLFELQKMGDEQKAYNENKRLIEAIASIDQDKTRITVHGIETAEQYTELLHIGCKNMQGFYFQRPLPESELVNHFSGKHNIKINCWEEK